MLIPGFEPNLLRSIFLSDARFRGRSGRWSGNDPASIPESNVEDLSEGDEAGVDRPEPDGGIQGSG